MTRLNRQTAKTLDGILDALPVGRYDADHRARTYARVLADALREGRSLAGSQARAAESAYSSPKG